MNRIDLRLVVLVFGAEIVVDFILQTLLFVLYAGSALDESMTAEEIKAVAEPLANSTQFLLISFARGTATTIVGGYFVGRYAKAFPYYNGLAIGVLGLALGLFFWGDSPAWFNVLGLLTTVPASIYGAHLAKRHRETMK